MRKASWKIRTSELKTDTVTTWKALRRGADDLVRLNVSVIVATGTQAVLAAKRAITNIPIVGTNMADPVADGLVATLARPGGNITGTTFLGPELQAVAHFGRF